MNYEAVAEWSQIASAILFVLALLLLWVKYIQPAVLKAQEAQNEQIAQAERHRDEAKARLDSLQGEIASAQSDAIAIRERAAAQAQSERDALIRETRSGGERVVRNAQGELARGRAAQRDRLRTELIDKALDRARMQASARVDDALNTQLIRSFVTDLERN